MLEDNSTWVCIIILTFICQYSVFKVLMNNRRSYKINKFKILKMIFIYLILIILIHLLVYKLIFTISTTIVQCYYLQYYELLNHNIILLELIIVSNILLLFLIPISETIKLKSEFRRKYYAYILLSIAGNVLIVLTVFGLVYVYTLGFTNNIIDFIIIAISSILLTSSIFSVDLISKIIKDNKLKLENKAIKENIEIQYKYYLNLQQSQFKVKKLYHDMKNHMICIENIYGSNDYIKSINDKLSQCNSTFNTKNMVLDVILDEKNSICTKNNINFTADIIFDECEFIKAHDICSIFANMLDNSIEACMKIEDISIDKSIKLRGTIVNRFFVIKCENSKANDISFNNKSILSDKDDLFLHGIGINSIKTSVERYNGNLEIDTCDNKFIMIIYIPLAKKIHQLGT